MDGETVGGEPQRQRASKRGASRGENETKGPGQAMSNTLMVGEASEPAFEPTQAARLEPSSMDALGDVEVEITLEIGRRRMTIAEVLQLGAGQTVQLDKAAGEPIDIYINGRLLGRGEAVVVGDRYGVRITELVTSERGAVR